MGLASGAGEIDLLLPLCKAFALGICHCADAMGTGYALDISSLLALCRGDRMTAGMAEDMTAGRQIGAHRDTFVKHETFPAPEAAFLRRLFEIFQDAAFQVEDILDAFGLHK